MSLGSAAVIRWLDRRVGRLSVDRRPSLAALLVLAIGPRAEDRDIVKGRGVERETGFEPATFCLGSRHSAS